MMARMRGHEGRVGGASRRSRVTRWALTGGVLAVVLVRLAGLDLFARPDAWAYDHVLVPLMPTPEKRDQVVLVEVDDASLRALGERWPLSRATWARFLERTRALSPALVVLDVVFDQPSDSSAAELGQSVALRLQASGLGETGAGTALAEFIDDELGRHDADRALSMAVAEAGNVVLGAIFTDDDGGDPGAALDGALPPLSCASDGLALQAASVTTCQPELTVAARGSGAMNVLVDPDGVVRRYPYAVAMDGAAYPSLALAAAMMMAESSEEADATVARALSIDGGAPHLRMSEATSRFPRVGFAEIVMSEDPAPATVASFADKILVVGATAPGAADQLRTPVGYGVPGVVLHAMAIDDLLSGQRLASDGAPAWVSVLETALVLLAFGGLLRLGARPLVLVGAAVALTAVHGALCYAAAAGPLWLLALTPAPVGLVLLGAGETAARWLGARDAQQALAAQAALLEAERVALERFQLVVETVADAIVTVDAEGCVTWMNPAAETLFLRRLASARGLHIGALVPSWRDEGVPVAAPGGTEAGKGAVGETEARLPSGERVPVEVSVTPASASAADHHTCVFRDIAARKALERAREELHATVNHELRTPVTSIIGALKLVGSGAMGPVDDGVRPLVAVAQQNAERLSALINELLDLAKLESGHGAYDFQPIALGPLCRRAVEETRGYGVEYGVAIAVEGAEGADDAEHLVRGSEGRLVQVVKNLLSNAVKHSPEGGTVRVGVAARAGAVRVSVADDGPGIPEAFREHLFERFATTDAADGKKRPGTGLGLSIARRIVEDHGGRIGFDSTVGAGTTFWFELPRLA